MSFSFLAVVDTLFQVVFDDVHFGDDALDTHELVGKFAGHSPWSHEVRSQVAFKTNIVVLDFILESPLLFSLQISFEQVLGEAVVECWIFDEVCSGFFVLAAQAIDIDFENVGVCDLNTGYEIVEISFMVWLLHLWRAT